MFIEGKYDLDDLDKLEDLDETTVVEELDDVEEIKETNVIDYNKLSVAKLKAIALEKKLIPNISKKLKKSELLTLLECK